jgi:competence protein ComEC
MKKKEDTVMSQSNRKKSSPKKKGKPKSQGKLLPTLLTLLCLAAALFGGKTLLEDTPGPQATTSVTIEPDTSAVASLTVPAEEDAAESESAPETSAAVGSGDSALTVYYLDVGQGDCELLESDGEYFLIDAGGDKEHKTTVENFLTDLGVEQLSYVIATHPHADHIQEMTAVVNGWDIGTFLLPDVTTSTATFEKLVDALDERNVDVEAPEPGDTFSFGSCTVQVLGPVNPTEDDLNASSLVVRVVCGETSFLFTGDCTQEEEADILSWAETNAATLDCDVLKVGHHGSYTSSSEDFLSAVSPSAAVISCGVDNSYGHPHQQTMDRLTALSLDIYRTDTMGTITAQSDGTNITFTTQQEESQ